MKIRNLFTILNSVIAIFIILYYGTDPFMQFISHKYISFWEFPLNREIVWDQSNQDKGNSIIEKEVSPTSGRVILVRNGSGKPLNCKYKLYNYQDIKKDSIRFLYSADVSNEFFSTNKLKGKFYNDGVTIGSLQILSKKSEAMLVLSHNPYISINDTVRSGLFHNNRKILEGKIFTENEVYALGFMIIIVFLIIASRIQWIFMRSKESNKARDIGFIKT